MKHIAPLAMALLLFFATGCDEKAGGSSANVNLVTKSDSVSYALGMDLRKGLTDQGWDLNDEAFFKGYREGLDETALMTREQGEAMLRAYSMELQAKNQEKMRAEQEASGAENQAKGQAFLEENKNKPGVSVLEGGLQYEIVTEGPGKSPPLDDQVKVHYSGTLIAGTEFDSSYGRGEPATFSPRGLIRAWQIILPMMKEGGKWKIYSPADLAYGANAPANIGPNQTLIFEMELQEVNPGQ